MIRQVDYGRLVGGGMVVDADFIVRGQGIGDFDREVAGVSFLAIGTDPAQPDSYPIRIADLGCRPDIFVEALLPAVQRVGIVVECQ